MAFHVLFFYYSRSFRTFKATQKTAIFPYGELLLCARKVRVQNALHINGVTFSGFAFGRGFGTQSFDLVIKFIKSTNLQVFTSPRLTQNSCHKPFFYLFFWALFSLVIKLSFP